MQTIHRSAWRVAAWPTRLLAALLVCAGPVVALYSCDGSGGGAVPGGSECTLSSLAPVQSLQEYAAECEEATGIAVPAFNCDDGTLVPTDNFDGQSCDRPNVLQHECDPGSRFQVLAKTQDAFVVAHCRKQGHPAGGYRDIAVIQYNRVNGATCWYQALTDDLPPQASAPIDGAGAGAGGGPGGTFPWLSPASTAGIGCVFCHDNGPIIRSPYLAQLHNVGPNPVTGFTDRLPGTSDNDDDFPRTGWNQSQPYTFPGNAFKNWKVYKLSVTGSTCTSCHRMGLATIDGQYASISNNYAELPEAETGTGRAFGPIATAADQWEKNPHSATSPIWMKPDQTTYVASVEQEAALVRDCAIAVVNGGNQLPDGGAMPPGCQATQYGQGFECPSSTAPAPAPLAAPPPSPAQFQQPEQVTGEGSCMCSLCWNQPFCFDPAAPEGRQVYPLPCARPEHRAVDATRLVGAQSPKQGGFYCWKPFSGAVMNASAKSCSSDESVRTKVENFDVCIDGATCARPTEQCGLPAGPTCPQVAPTARPSTCVAVPDYLGSPYTADDDALRGASAVVSDLAMQCARFGTTPPSGAQPARYCYLSCVNSFDCALDTASPECLGCETTNNLQAVTGTFPVALAPTQGSATISVRDLSGNFQRIGILPLSGRMDIRVPKPCLGPVPSATCTATMTRLALASSGTVTIQGLTISNLRLLSDNPASNSFVTSSSTGRFFIPAHTALGVTGAESGRPYLYGLVDPDAPIDTTWDWSARTVRFANTVVSDDGSYQIQLNGTGTFVSLPPTAVASASPKSIACGGSTRLSAISSLDPDGAADIKSVTWTTARTRNWQATGMTVDVRPPGGTQRYYAKVVDSVGSSH